MDIVKIIGVVLLGVSLSWILKLRDNKFASFVSLFTALTISVYTITALSPVIEISKLFASHVATGSNTLNVLLKACGIEFLINGICTICRDSGEKSLADMLEHAANVSVLLLTVPLIKNLFDNLIELLYYT